MSRILEKGINAGMMLPRVATVFFHKALGWSDYGRWENPASLESWWDTRTEKLASLVTAGSRTLEFGAGRRQLERFLPPGCVYFASDLTDRGCGTIVCDLNQRPLPDLRQLNLDVVVFGGVLEYIRDVPALAGWLAGQTPSVVTSYECTRSGSRTLQRLSELFRRSHLGYMSHLTLTELIAAFDRAGFRCVTSDAWENQQLFVFHSKSRTIRH